MLSLQREQILFIIHVRVGPGKDAARVRCVPAKRPKSQRVLVNADHIMVITIVNFNIIVIVIVVIITVLEIYARFTRLIYLHVC